MRGLKRVAGVFVLVVACARMAAPPGGPPRNTPPVLIGFFPDSGVAPCSFRGVAEFRFDEVTSDAGEPNFGTGRGTLERLILLSPDTAVPAVEWHRDRITVRPRSGWRPNRTYRIELLPGVADLHNNIAKSGRTIAFTTCGPAPTRVLSGRVIDWMGTPRAVPGALVQAFHLPDSVGYRAATDSTGRFRLAGLPDGPYLVVASTDPNKTHKRGPADSWDSVRVSATRDTVGEIWVFPRDTLPPTITTVVRQDSQSILVTFRSPIDPALRVDSTKVHVRLLVGKDSVSIGTVYAYPRAFYDSLQKLLAPPPKADTTRARDSTRKDTLARPVSRPPPIAVRNRVPPPPADLPKQVRPILGNTMVVRTLGQVQLGKRYYVEIDDVRSAAGRTGTARTTLTTANPPTAADSAKAKAKADSLRSDSLKRVKPDTGHGLRLR